MLFYRPVILSLALIACFVSNALAVVQYTLHKSSNPNDDERDAYTRITEVMDEALYYYNTYTTLTKFINVYYSSGVPTAEASSNGDLRFGKDRNYMFVGTAMHEIAHTMGMGTTNEYRSMFVNGVFQGEKAQALLREIDGPNAVLKGDSQHFWPYGLNYRSEVKSKQDLINHAKIVNAMYQDIFKESGPTQVRIKSLANGKCMGITSSNTLELMDCGNSATLIKIYAMASGNNTVYRIELGSRVIDIPNESTAAGIKASTWQYNSGAHQKYIFETAQSTQSTNIPDTKSKCWSESQGYSCCKGCRIIYEDESGKWGVENDDWCGIEQSCSSCWSLPDYPCCQENASVVYSDESGEWGIENDDWCGIRKTTSNNKKESEAKTIYLRNLKSGHYLQAVGNDVYQNPLSRNNNSFIWQMIMV